MVLTGAHYIYILFMIIILITMIMKKDIIVPCVLGVFCLGLFYKQDPIAATTAVFGSFVVALNELGGIILIIGIMVALLKTLEDNNAIHYMVKPFTKIIKNPTTAFFVSGITMMILSWFFWPSPASALVGAVFLPVAMSVGLPAIGLAVAINLFGHGIALSTDFVIQGAPSISAAGAGIPVSQVTSEGMILFWVMGIVTVAVAFYMLRRDMKKGIVEKPITSLKPIENREITTKTKVSTWLVAVGFVADIILMYVYQLKGGDASALLGGTAMFLLIIVDLINSGKKCLDKIYDHVTEGLVFGIKIFGAIIPIAAFFYMGDMPITTVLGDVLQKGSGGLLSDIGLALSQAVPFNKFAAASIETVVGGITGLDGSGFSGMSLVGSLASVFGTALHAKVGALAALGQISAIWVGGGCLVPWSLVAAAAICGVSPVELGKRNFIPIMIGLAVTTVVAVFII